MALSFCIHKNDSQVSASGGKLLKDLGAPPVREPKVFDFPEGFSPRLNHLGLCIGAALALK